MNIKNHKKTLILIIAILVLFFGYWFLFVSNKESSGGQSSGLTNTTVNVSNTPYDKEFVESLLSLSYINLDVSIFNTRTYQALNFPETPFVVNFSRESGRDNPFLPIGNESTNTNSNIQNQININPNTNTSTTTSVTPSASTNTSTTTTNSVNPIRRNF